MKKSFLLLVILCFCLVNITQAQNVFPSSGNVGVGITNPDYQLQINSSSLGTINAFKISAYDGTYNPRVFLNYVTSSSSQTLEFNSSYSTNTGYANFSFLNGNVGIGTASPGNPLEIELNSGQQGLEIFNSNTIDGRATIEYVSSKFGSPYFWEVGLSPGGGSNFWGVRNVSESGAPVVWGIDANNKMFLGTNLDASSGSKFYIKSDGNTSSTQSLRIDNSSDVNLMLLNDAGDMTITGNVGIGTTNPQSKLAVNGNIAAKKLTITQTGWSDFVFDSTYHLPPLSNTEAFIKANHHLPDIPSAEEIESKGLDLGSMEQKQMQKIEELTLYLIQAEKGISELKNQNEQLQDEMKKYKQTQMILEREVNQWKNKSK